MLIPLGILASAGGGAAGSFDLISTTLLTGSQASVTFDVSTYASTYKHLQIRLVGRLDYAGTSGYTKIRLNGDTGANYSSHYMYSDPNAGNVISGASLGLGYLETGGAVGNTQPSGAFAAAVFDILDAFSTSKFKTTRMLDGSAYSTLSNINLRSGSWRSTSAVTSINIAPGLGSNFIAGSRFSLYGIKG